ncbi:pirin family protein [Aquimarina mytili]|uniref:Pirin family protein n=1 Tax=Aquimarina mytili TaxID=874423 RepID=A0A937A0S9_9FLAO|nr:pirin family protein [Aquimarina mytili]MBL0682925.1 pirin family protein [Aquimarina mytili]
MVVINKANQVREFGNENFHITSTSPGINLGNPNDYGLAQLGRIDYSEIKPGTIVGMHPHQYDEIFSYMRKGVMTHEDSTGNLIEIGGMHLMMMNAGTGIYHEERVPENGEKVDMLQIFMRPSKDNFQPRVQFSKLNALNSENQWRLVAGSTSSEAPLEINSEIAVWDAHINKSIELKVSKNKIGLLYVFNGKVKIKDNVLGKFESAVLDENITVGLVSSSADLLYFEMDEHAEYSRSGAYSGM